MNQHRKSLVFLKYNPNAKLRLFCCHHAGGSANAFYPWLEKLTNNFELIVLELPGRGNNFNEPLLNNMNDIINYFFDDFCTLLEKPYILFGHSMGSIISYELIKKLENTSFPPPLKLIVSGCRAPHLSSNRNLISHLPKNEFILGLKKFNGIPEELYRDPAVLELFLPILRSDFIASESYFYIETNPINCQIIALSGKSDLTVQEKDVQEWQMHTSHNFIHHSFPGDHFFVRSSQNEIIKIIKHQLNYLP